MYRSQEATTRLHEERLDAVVDAARSSGARSLLDLGCGDGEVLVRLVRERWLERILGLDRDAKRLEQARQRLDAERLSVVEGQGRAARIELRRGSMIEPDDGLNGFDCALLVETIEHIDPKDLAKLEKQVFARMHPRTVIITTPNAEYNPLLEVPPNRLRHPDHRFEWDRARFQRWARGVAQRHLYRVRHRDVGGVHPIYGGATQIALFQLTEA